MNLSKLFEIVTPLMIVAGMGVIIILNGFVDMSRQNNVLHFFFGIPIAGGAAGLHFLIRRLAQRNVITIWVIEAVLVALGIYGFLHS